MNPAPVMLGGGLTTSRMGFGAMALTGVYGRSRHEDNVATINHALDVGVTFIDTADIYGDGESERTVGRVAQERRRDDDCNQGRYRPLGRWTLCARRE